MIIPGLKESAGIPISMVRYFFKPMQKGTFAVEQYKAIIDATVLLKDDSSSKDNVNACQVE